MLRHMQRATHGRRSVTVEFDPSSDPIRGRVAGTAGPQREFSGWLELIAALQQEATISEEDVREASPRELRPAGA
jgi:hypothetical protein